MLVPDLKDLQNNHPRLSREPTPALSRIGAKGTPSRGATPLYPLLLLTVTLSITAACIPGATTTSPTPAPPSTPATRYTERTPTPGGTGKVYLGREIAQVMGVGGASWLERPQREQEEHLTALIDALELTGNDVVADIGAGSGVVTLRIAYEIPKGRVLAVDVQPEMLERLEERAKDADITNIETVLGTEKDPHLEPGTVDIAILVDAYHEFTWPYEMMTAIAASLRPGGRVILVEYRAEDPEIPIKRLHKMTQAQAIAEMAAVGLIPRKTLDVLPRQHLMIFQAP